MYRVIIWGIGFYYNSHLNCIKYQELQGLIEVVGLTSNHLKYVSVDGYQCLEKRNLAEVAYDYCIVAMKDMEEAVKEAELLGISKEKLIPIKVFTIPGFRFDKYVELKKSRLSIISKNCWGGLCYHYFGLPFESPFINLSLPDEDFNRMMRNLDEYLALPLCYKQMIFHERSQSEYPIATLGDVSIHFIHYHNFEEAEQLWEKRKKRINKENMLIVSQTLSWEVAEEFEHLPYEHKVIFVPFVSSFSSCCQVDFVESKKDENIGIYTNRIAGGQLSEFDLFGLLCHEKKFIRGSR